MDCTEKLRAKANFYWLFYQYLWKERSDPRRKTGMMEGYVTNNKNSYIVKLKDDEKLKCKVYDGTNRVSSNPIDVNNIWES